MLPVLSADLAHLNAGGFQPAAQRINADSKLFSHFYRLTALFCHQPHGSGFECIVVSWGGGSFFHFLLFHSVCSFAFQFTTLFSVCQFGYGGRTFENDNGRNPQTGIARRYVEHWEDMRTDNIGCLFWGGVGTGKSYLAGCIANALMEKEIPVHMTNFALILNDLAASFEGRNEYISRLCRYPLLILDDFGMERGTEYGLEQVFNVIDSRYRSGKPLIVTTNLTLDDLRNPEDTAHSRIYDRLLSMCVPVRFTGENFRQETAQRKMESMKKLITD